MEQKAGNDVQHILPTVPKLNIYKVLGRVYNFPHQQKNNIL